MSSERSRALPRSVGAPTAAADTRDPAGRRVVCGESRLTPLRAPGRSPAFKGARGRTPSFFVFLLLAPLTVSSLLGCGVHGPSSDDIERSRRELELAAALHEEQNIPGAIGHLREALELDPENAEAHVLLGIIQFQRANHPSAEEHTRRGVELLVEHGRRGATLAEARNVLGLVLIAREEYDEAAEVLEASALDEMNTAPHLAWGNLGLARLEAGRAPEAVEALETAVRMQPRFCVGWYRLGRAHFAANDLQLAEEALVRAIEADEACADAPQLQGAWRLRGEVRARLGRRADALADLERCVALGADTEEGQRCQRLLDRTPPPPPNPSPAAPPDTAADTAPRTNDAEAQP